MYADDQDNWDDCVEQVLGTYRGVPNLTTGESPFFLVLWKKWKPTSPPTTSTTHQIPRQSEFRIIMP